MKKELLEGLTEEQIAKVKACKSQDELLKIAKEEGVELNEEQLEAVSGGCATPEQECSICHGKAKYATSDTGITVCMCPNCGTFIV